MLEFILKDYPKDIIDFLKETFFLVEIRERVGKHEGIIFEIRTKEHNHNIPHLHASYGEYNISISILDNKVLSGNLPRKQEKYAVDWVINNKNKLINDWNRIHIYKKITNIKSLLNK